ncbi:hypothetical protein P7K49_020028 [Saguinus oedipus]|uniref:Uncharacterized protein n=1 Tax=Saguinus oedipus TaxID=9490 RepID=A0ABQ9UZD6_SAGOE|nr:hypothetical protein P7K49_020028 [Saguinus oedipus]
MEENRPELKCSPCFPRKIPILRSLLPDSDCLQFPPNEAFPANLSDMGATVDGVSNVEIRPPLKPLKTISGSVLGPGFRQFFDPKVRGMAQLSALLVRYRKVPQVDLPLAPAQRRLAMVPRWPWPALRHPIGKETEDCQSKEV